VPDINTDSLPSRKADALRRRRERFDRRALRLLLRKIPPHAGPHFKLEHTEGDYRAELEVLQHRPGSLCIFFDSNIKPRADKPSAVN
jgi:aromatic ring-cleaving dioxygenase